MTAQTTYRDCSIGGASPIGLIIALFDALARDLRRAADAVRRDDIDVRCQELNHALLIIGQLESWVDAKGGGEPARQLSAFYSYVRAKLMEASIKKSAALLEAQMQTVLHIRSKWQQLDSTSVHNGEAPPLPAEEKSATRASSPPSIEEGGEEIRFSQSA